MAAQNPLFQTWPKTPRLYRDVIITEKIDGANAQILFIKANDARHIDPDISLFDPTVIHTFWDESVFNLESGGWVYCFAGSRNRWVTPEDDNFGFGAWVQENCKALYETLGLGRHYGEWYGRGIQRGYGMEDRRLALFNTNLISRLQESSLYPTVHTVPVLYEGPFSDIEIRTALDDLQRHGSMLEAYDYNNEVGFFSGDYQPAEGVCVFHTQSRKVYKVLLENDEMSKTEANNASR